jgi:hypothetical protein
LSLPASDMAGEFRANHTQRATIWGYIAFHLVRHREFNAEVAEIAEGKELTADERR